MTAIQYARKKDVKDNLKAWVAYHEGKQTDPPPPNHEPKPQPAPPPRPKHLIAAYLKV